MLIVEGTDCIGKTTFCKALLKRLEKHGPWIYSHFTKLPPRWRYPYDYFARMSRHVVQDRFHMSEVCYRRARQETQLLSPLSYKLVDAHLRLLGGFTVVITADDDFVRSKYASNQMHGVDVHVEANRCFQAITAAVDAPLQLQVFGSEYSIDWDLHYHIKDHYPAEVEDFSRFVIQKYLQQLEEVDAALFPED